jgi:hypothetical protein
VARSAIAVSDARADAFVLHGGSTPVRSFVAVAAQQLLDQPHHV